jgi:dephospho-CoA kinase
MIVGLTGGIGCGKSEVTRRFQALGISVVDADVIARDIVSVNSRALEAIAFHFGADILNTNSTLNREKLRNIIFSNQAEKKWLENLLHPIIRAEIIQELKKSHSIYTILVSPLLLETTQNELVDRILVIDTTSELQIERASKRDKVTREQIIKIMATQLTREERLRKAEDVIENFGDLHTLDSQVKNFHSKYLLIVEK